MVGILIAVTGSTSVENCMTINVQKVHFVTLTNEQVANKTQTIWVLPIAKYNF